MQLPTPFLFYSKINIHQKSAYGEIVENINKHIIMIRNLLVVLLLVVFLTRATGQVHAPDNGQTIEFYPVNDSLRSIYNGYDCFYDFSKVYKKNKVTIKPKYRYSRNKQQLTPFNEIEGHSFLVIEAFKEDGEKGKSSTYNIKLQRDDNVEILMCMPFNPQKESNVFTKSMIVSFYNSKGNKSNGIFMPFLSPSIDSCRKQLCGKTLVRTDSINSLNNYYIKSIYYRINGGIERCKQAINIIIGNGNLINKLPTDSIYLYGSKIEIENLEYINVPSYTFKQPVANVIYNSKSYKLPLFDFYGKGENTLLTDVCFINLFKPYEDV